MTKDYSMMTDFSASFPLNQIVTEVVSTVILSICQVEVEVEVGIDDDISGRHFLYANKFQVMSAMKPFQIDAVQYSTVHYRIG